MKIRVAHSPDADDAFMFYALAEGKIDTNGIEFEHVLSDIQTLNQRAISGEYEVSAISIHAYPYVAVRYALMSCGGSVGYKYGPIVVSKRPLKTLKGKVIAIPGMLTTAYLILKLFEKNFTPKVIPFDQIIDEVSKGNVEAGLVIHEGQLFYADKKLYKFIDLGEWWYEETKLPLPLGGNIVRRDLGKETMEKVSRYVRESIKYSLEHREEALNYAIQFARGLGKEKASKFVSMYVNKFTIDYGKEGRKAISILLSKGYEEGIITNKVEVDFV
ncbi:MAG: ABC transporter substrate-binding protein [Euryarchaeota archaeon]|nr:ABC transporter substrate-binding protein [Euryarchaeota archaeon]